MIVIYGRANSSNVRKVLWLAEEIGLEIDRRDYGRGYAPTDTPEFKALNPNAKVPVMEEDGFVLWESHAILRYLAAKYGPEWYPDELQHRARVEQWLDWVMGEIHEPLRQLFFTLHVKPGSDPEGIPAAEEQAARLCSILDAQLERTPYIAGEQPSIADCAIGMMVHRWYYMDITRPSLPAVEGYYTRLKARPAFQGPVLNAGV